MILMLRTTVLMDLQNPKISKMDLQMNDKTPLPTSLSLARLCYIRVTFEDLELRNPDLRNGLKNNLFCLVIDIV